MARPLAVIGFTYFLSLMLASVIGLSASVVVAFLLFLFCVLALAWPALRKNSALLAALMTAVAAFSLFATANALTIRPLERLAGQTGYVRAMTVDEPYVTDTSCRYEAVVQEDGFLPKGTRLYVWLANEEMTPEPFTVLSGEIEVQRIKEKGLLPYQKADGIVLQGWPTSAQGLIDMEPSEERPWYAFFYSLRKEARAQILQHLPGEAGELTAGICFGEKQELSEESVRDFRGAGLSHLLVVSGFHMAVIAGAILAFLRFLRVPERLAALLSGLAVLFFMALTGFSPSVMRSGIMCLVMLGGMLTRRKADGLNSLGLALLILCLFNVYAPCDIGLVLSVSATVGLLTLQPRMQKAIMGKAFSSKHPWTKRVVASLAVTFSALLMTIPVLALFYGEISLISPLSNLVATPIGSLLMETGCLAVLLSVLPGMGLISDLLFKGVGLLAECLLSIAGWLGNTPLSFVSTRSLYLLVWIFGTLFLVCLGWRLLRGRGIRIASALSVIVLLTGTLTSGLVMRGVTVVTALDSGEGAAVLLERDGHAALVVMGENSGGRMRKIGTSLSGKGIRHLDFILFPDSDDPAAFDIGLLLEQVQARRVIYDPEGEYAYQVDAYIPEEQRTYIGNTTLSFWNDSLLECRKDGWLRLTVGKTRLLFCPVDQDVYNLPESWQNTNWVLYSQIPPNHAGNLQAQAGVLSCPMKEVNIASRKMPFSPYPIAVTALDGDVRAVTRGMGDVEFR